MNQPTKHQLPDSCPTLILASRSPRRRELLAAAGYQFRVVPPGDDAEDGARDGESPAELVARLARQKAADVVETLVAVGGGPLPGPVDQRRPSVVIGCDTIVECGGTLIGKPTDADDARGILGRLSGREHRVLSGLCLWPIEAGGSSTQPRLAVAETRLRMDELSQWQIDDYLASGQWQGKAGAFGYQDRLGWVHVVEGSESNVVGLPMELLSEMLVKVARAN